MQVPRAELERQDHEDQQDLRVRRDQKEHTAEKVHVVQRELWDHR